MQSRGFPRRVAALVAALALLVATPVLAAPVSTGDATSAGFSNLDALWSRLLGVFGIWNGENGQGVAPDRLTATGPPGRNDAPASIDRVTGANGAGVDPDGSPQATSAPTPGPGYGDATGPGGTDPSG
jgi:hypothetical protein